MIKRNWFYIIFNLFYYLFKFSSSFFLFGCSYFFLKKNLVNKAVFCYIFDFDPFFSIVFLSIGNLDKSPFYLLSFAVKTLKSLLLFSNEDSVFLRIFAYVGLVINLKTVSFLSIKFLIKTTKLAVNSAPKNSCIIFE